MCEVFVSCIPIAYLAVLVPAAWSWGWGKVKLGPVLPSSLRPGTFTTDAGSHGHCWGHDVHCTRCYSFLMLQDDNFSLSLLNELSVKYGIQTHLSHAPLPQKLEELREYLRREIKKELKVRE